jgi:hypothetical protein
MDRLSTKSILRRNMHFWTLISVTFVKTK